MRSMRHSLWPALCLTAALVLTPPVHGESLRVLVQHSPLAGSQYYAASRVWNEIRVGDRLTLVREPDNRHDRLAIRVEWNGHKLGYVPRTENGPLARALDTGERLDARVTHLRDDPDPWRRVEFAVYVIL